jgi:rhamnosyltransferase subunit B
MSQNGTVLLAWELGMGLGHARRLFTIAESMKARGWSPFVAARELWACADEYRSAKIPLLQAPKHRGLRPQEITNFRARGFADILAACGYREIELLIPTVFGWDGLIDILKPDVIVADYSPLLTLTAYRRIPVVAIGDGFVLPPVHLPQMPMLRPGASEMPNERTLLLNAAAVQRRRKQAVPQSLPSLIGGQAHVVCTYPETDLYADLRLEAATGPIDSSLSTLGRPSKEGVFAYLDAAFTSTAKLLQVLSASGCPLEVFVRNTPHRMKSALRALNIRVHDTTPRLSEVAERSSIIVHHGGIGTIEASMALGRPQLLLPAHFEQNLNASNQVRLGLARHLRPGFSLAEGAAAVEEAISSRPLAEKAQDTAAYLARRPSHTLERIIALCEELTGR